MVGQTCVLFLIPFELLLLPALHTTVNLLRRTVGGLVKSLNNKEIRIMPYILRVDGIAGTLTEREEINSIQQVRLSHSVLPEKSIQFRREGKFHLFQILVVEYGYMFQYHIGGLSFLCFSGQR